MTNIQGNWSFREWESRSKVIFLEDRFCMWLQDERIYLIDTHTQRKTSLIEAYNGSEEKGFKRALAHFENFITIVKGKE
tara:strand:+ start:276 stop:512 length:237 start_codon:yes stop_codon:yes gene_type:complete